MTRMCGGFFKFPITTFIIPFKRIFATHLTHFDRDTFNVTVIWLNREIREAEGYEQGDVGWTNLARSNGARCCRKLYR